MTRAFLRLPARELPETLARLVLLAAASASLLLVALIFLFLLAEALPFLSHPGLAGLLERQWMPVSLKQATYGLLPLIAGSLQVTLIAAMVAVPLSLAAAVYLAEVAAPWESRLLKPLMELLAGIPSVVIGFFGLVVLAPWVKQVFHLSSGLNALTGGLLLALMATPTMLSISEDALRNVPRTYREASLALGASPFSTIWRVTLPAALPGIIAAMMLGLGRVVGETMAVLMVTGNAAIITLSPLESVRTLTATIAAEMGEVSFGSPHYRALFCVGVTLMAGTFLINLTARQILKRYQAP